MCYGLADPDGLVVPMFPGPVLMCQLFLWDLLVCAFVCFLGNLQMELLFRFLELKKKICFAKLAANAY